MTDTHRNSQSSELICDYIKLWVRPFYFKITLTLDSGGSECFYLFSKKVDLLDKVLNSGILDCIQAGVRRHDQQSRDRCIVYFERIFM